MNQVKAGDLAVVIGPKGSRVMGAFVRVLRPWDGGKIDGSEWTGRYTKIQGQWFVIELPHKVGIFDTRGNREYIKRLPYLGQWMQPIRGQSVKEKSECLAIA